MSSHWDEKITEVIDAATVRSSHRKNPVRLVGVELSGNPDSDERAKHYAQGRLLGKVVRIDTFRRDKEGCSCSHVYIEDRLINSEIQEQLRA